VYDALGSQSLLHGRNDCSRNEMSYGQYMRWREGKLSLLYINGGVL